MSYQVLARKWRPRNFREMVGQEHVLRALVNALDHDRLHHAYLFTGTRGVGKTTIARILAKCLNCESGVSSQPCDDCSSCREISEGRSIDLWEVDAASRTKVEDTRELLENVQYAPTQSRFKVYLIDEAHMLSAHSFNALLKTLEEPPPHVKFLLATTDPQKLPATVLSRCLQFNLKNMPPDLIVGHLCHVLDQEMITYEEPALWLLGRAAGGSMRDALSLTDQAIAFGSGTLTESDVRAMLGTVDLSFVCQLLEEIVGGDPASVLAVVDTMSQHAPDFEGSLIELISLLHRVTIAQAVPEAIDNTWGDAERVANIAGAITAEDAQLFYQVAINGRRDIAYAADPRSGFEMLLLRMIAFRPGAVLDESLEPQDLQQVEIVQDNAVAKEVDPPLKKSRDAPAAAAQNNPEISPPVEVADTGDDTAGTVSQDSNAGLEQRAGQNQELGPLALSPATWPAVLEQLELVGIVYNIASHCEIRADQDGALVLTLDQDNASLFNEGHAAKIRQALENYSSAKLSVSITVGEVTQETPAMLKTRLTAERQREAVDSIERDPQLQNLIDRFDGKLDLSSVIPLEP
ncbi:MAG: DNA polymerase III subunit gamma/tau [Halieaceae bacterium]|nr:DNA polymerase III subunit gamma/tau [Halieaceae bacterium]